MDKAPKSVPIRAPGNWTTLRLFFTLTFVLAVASLPVLFDRGRLSGHDLGTYSLLWVGLLAFSGLITLAELVILIFVWIRRPVGTPAWLDRVSQPFLDRPWLAWVAILAGWAGYVFIIFYRFQKQFADSLPQVWVFWLVVGIGAFFFSAAYRKTPVFLSLLFVGLLYGVGVKSLGYLPSISTYPFSLEWSEGSRFYYASLPVSRWLYGEQLPLSFLHPSRYLLQSIPYWIPGAGLLVHRTWQVLLWLVMSFFSGFALARRFHFHSRAWTLAVTLWAGLFLLQGPVYYHLAVCVILVLWGFDARRLWKTMLFVALASAWAGISRVNWIPVPTMLAASLYLLDVPFCTVGDNAGAGLRGVLTGWMRYLWRPAVWGVVGVLSALSAQAAYVVFSGHDNVSAFGSSFTSALLWYRLKPSLTFPMGVLPAILLLSAPLLLMVAGNVFPVLRNWHWLRILGLALMGLTLFVGGLVVSTKIGGGSNVHNLDAFLVILMIVGITIALGRYASETCLPVRAWQPWLLVLAVMVTPVVWNLDIGTPFMQRDFQQGATDLKKINDYVETYAPKGEVLFITQRQLEVFHLVNSPPLVPDYELMTLTEMAISNNHAYLDRFYEDLRNHRFSLIVADRQRTEIKSPVSFAFAEENNAWVDHVSTYILQYYKQAIFLDTQGIQLLVPK